jgi:aspartyl-tRNA(Asn)/glutamyl-tRNA(Gln) amidotransferase subunit A
VEKVLAFPRSADECGPPSRKSAPKASELARLSAVELVEGYRNGSFTPSDVIDEVIDALLETDELCNVMVTADVRLGSQGRCAGDQLVAQW